MPLTRVAADPWAASHSVPQFSPLPVDTTSQHVPLTAERAEAVVRTHIERSRPSLDAGALLDEAALAEAAGLLLNPTAPNAMGRTYSTPGRPMGGRGGVSGVGQGLAVHVGPQLHDGYDSGPPTRSPSRRPGPRIGDEEEDEEEEEEAEEDDESDGEGRAAPSPATRARMLDPDLMAAWMRGAQADGAEAGGQGGAAASPGSRARTGQSALARRISCPEALLAEEAEAAAAAAAGGGARPEDALEPLANHHMWMANRGRALGGYDPGAGHTGLLYCAKSVLEAAGGGRRAHLVGDGWQARDAVSIFASDKNRIGGGFPGESRGARLARLAAEGAAPEVLHSLAAVIIQSYCRGWKARREVARIKSLRRGDAEAAAARASALAAAAALAREQERCRRQLRTAAKDCLLAVQAQQDYERTRARLAAARGLGAGAAAAPPPPPPSIPPALWSRCQELGLDPIQILLDGGMLSRQIEDIIAASQLAAQLPRRAADVAARMRVIPGDGSAAGTGAGNASAAGGAAPAGRYGGGRQARDSASSGGGGGARTSGGGGAYPSATSDDGGASLSSAARASSGVLGPDAEGSSSTNIGASGSFAGAGGLPSGGSGVMAPRASLQGQRGGGGAAPLRPSLAGAGSGKQLLPLVAGSGAGGGSGIGGGAAGRAYNTAELVEQLLQQQALGALALPNGPSGGGPLGPGRKISMGPLAAAGSAAAAAAAAAGGMGAAVKRNPARRMSASGAMGDGAGGSGGGGGGGGSVMANRRPAGGFAAGPTAPHLGGGFAGAGANSNAAASTGAPSLGRLSVPVNASSAVPQPFTAGSGVTGTRAQLAGPSGRQRRMSDLVAGSGAAAGAGLASQPSATALLPGLPQAPSGLAPDAAASGAQYSQHLPMRARSFVLGEHSSVSASGVPPPHPGAGGGAGGGLPLAPIRTGRVSQTGGASGSPANGPGTAIMAALLANMGAGTGGAATAGGSAGHHGPAHAPHLRPASGGLHSGAGPGGLPLPPSAMLQGHGLGTGLGSAANSPLAAVAAGGGAFARLTAQSSASSFGESSPGLPLRRRHSYVGSPTPSSGGGEAMPPAPGPNSGGGLGGVDGVAMLHMQGQGQGAVPHGVSGNVGSGGSMSGPVGAAAVAAALGRAGGGSGSGKASPATGSPRSFTHGSMVPRQASGSSLGPLSGQPGGSATTPGGPLPPLLMAHGSLGALHGTGGFTGSGVSSGVSSGTASPSLSSLNTTPGSGGAAGPVPPGAGEVPFGRGNIRRGSNLAPTTVAAALAAAASPPPAHPPPHPPAAPGASGSPITARRLHSLTSQSQAPIGVSSSTLGIGTTGAACGGGGVSMSPVGMTAAGLAGGLAAFAQSPIASTANSFSGPSGSFAAAALVPAVADGAGGSPSVGRYGGGGTAAPKPPPAQRPPGPAL